MSPRRPRKARTPAPADGRRHYVVHDRDGRILALAPVTPPPAGEARVGWRPLPAAGQRVVEIDLEPAQLALGLDVVLATFRVDTRRAKAAVLRRITRGA